jgi:hypothetical protein
MTVEVKSKLTARELRVADASAAGVAKLQHAPPVGASAFPEGHRVEHVVPYLLAFDTARSSKSDVERYDEARAGKAPSILGICVVGRGFWFRDNEAWVKWKFSVPYGDVVGFITAVVNTRQRIASTRFQPDLRQYVIC